ncbi:MAG: ABC transporter permease [Bacteriovoracaceae bacterium]|nr:ABC transporter permease [Bacteriovoracaceae bacterium]
MTTFFKGVAILSIKELKDFFLSPLVYILTGCFSLLLGWLFFNYLILSKNHTALSLTNSVLRPIFGNMNFIFLFFAPIITMRSFAEEKKRHTIELLFLSNLSHLQIILGKFIGVFFVSLFMLSLTVLFPIILAFSGFTDWGIVTSSYLGIIFSIMCYLAVGLFTSSLTQNQIISAISGFAILLGLMLLVATGNATNNFIVTQIFQYISVAFHYEGFTRGAIRSFDIAYYLSFLSFFFFLTHKSLDSRNW